MQRRKTAGGGFTRKEYEQLKLFADETNLKIKDQKDQQNQLDARKSASNEEIIAFVLFELGEKQDHLEYFTRLFMDQFKHVINTVTDENLRKTVVYWLPEARSKRMKESA